MPNDILVDALPYIDHGYDEAGVRDAALAMVQEECRQYRPNKNYLAHLPPLNVGAFETPLMRAEFERISNGVPMEPFSMKRYELPPPPPGKTTDEAAWQECVANTKAQLEHQSVRTMNLDLMLEYGCELWKAHLEVFTALQAKAQQRQQKLRIEMQEVNWQRKSKQGQTGEMLRSLEAQWVGLVSKNFDIEQACVKLEEIAYAYRQELELKQTQRAIDEASETIRSNGAANGVEGSDDSTDRTEEAKTNAEADVEMATGENHSEESSESTETNDDSAQQVQTDGDVEMSNEGEA